MQDSTSILTVTIIKACHSGTQTNSPTQATHASTPLILACHPCYHAT